MAFWQRFPPVILLPLYLFTAWSTAAQPPALSNTDSSPEAPLGSRYFGALQGKATVSAGGNASYVVPLEIPPGSGGMTPQVSLNYNSNMKNGLLGLGWFTQGSASSQITRCPKTLSQDGEIHAVDYSYEDRFCLDGQRLLVAEGTYGSGWSLYRTETDNFSRVQAQGTVGNGPGWFVVSTKDGLVKEYGVTDDSRIEAEGKNTIRVWALNSVEDRAGNRYDIAYHESNAEGEYYPTEITYGGNTTAGTSPHARIEFAYETRSDNIVTYRGGSKERRHPKRLKTVKTIVDNALVRTASLTYQEIGHSKTSRITQIDNCDSQGNCQEPIELEWHSPDGLPSFAETSLYVPYGEGVGCQYNIPVSQYGAPRWHDYNGDGLPDYTHIVPLSNATEPYYQQYTYAYSLDFEIMLSSPAGYVSQTWTSGAANRKDQLVWLDINGDGKTDVAALDARSVRTRTAVIDVAISTGDGFNNQIWRGHTYNSRSRRSEFEFHDMNGDRLPDLVVVEHTTTSAVSPATIYVRLNTGSDFGTESVWASNIAYTAEFFDINADGRVDIVDSSSVHLSNGSGFDPVENWGGPYGLHADYNGDGLPDLNGLDANGYYRVYLNTGSSFSEQFGSSFVPLGDVDGNGLGDAFVRTYDPYGGTTKLEWYFSQGDSGQGYSFAYHNMSGQFPKGRNLFQQITDFNGDGLLDYTVAKTNTCFNSYPGWYQAIWRESGELKRYLNTGKQPNLLKTISSGLAVEETFAYKPLTDSSVYTKGSSAGFPEQDVQDSTHVVSQFSRSDGLGGTFDTQYLYEGFKRDLQGRGNLGFAKITAKNLDQNTTTITEYAQAFPFSSQPIKVEVKRTSDGRLLSSITTTYSVHGTIGSGSVFAYVDTRAAKAFDLGDGRLLSTSTTSNHCDAYGNITDTTLAVTDHENNQTFQTQTLRSYDIDDSWQWRIAQLSSQTVKQWLNGVTRTTLDKTTSHSYDWGTGLLSSTTRQPGGGTGVELTTTLVRDDFGNVTSETVSGPGIDSRTSTVVYESRGQYAQNLTNPLGHKVALGWDARLGKKTSATDANGLTTTWSSDGFGRQVLETRPDGTTTQTGVYKNTGGGGFYIETIASAKPPTRQFFDSLGRPTRFRTQSFSGNYVNQDTQYDSKGRAHRSSEPYFEGDSIAWNSNSYDDLSRVTAITAADPSQSSQTNYHGFSVVLTDALSRTSTRRLNAAGQVIQIIDAAGTNMAMVYDPAGNRTQIINAQGSASQNAVTYTYDLLGRLLAQNDPDHGIYTYTYDALGQRVSERSPKMAAANQSTTYQYDLLGRMTSRTEPEGTATWAYDNTAGGNLGRGQLHRESQSGYSKTYAYHSTEHGRLTRMITAIDSSSYTTIYTYNALGQLDAETYPSGHKTTRQYNTLGYLERVSDNNASDVLYQLVDTDAAGQPTMEWKADGSTTSQTYDGNSSRISDQHTVNGAANIQHFSYSYDNAGNMSSRSDVANGLSESFGFDNLDRLTSTQVTGTPANTFDFDITGNITQKSDVGNPFLYTGAAIHAVTQITNGNTTRNISYDSNGNLTNGDGAPTITWSSYNKPTKLVKGNMSYTFDYGSDRKRYKKTHNGNITRYVGENYEEISYPTSMEKRLYIRANGRVVMERRINNISGTQNYIVHRDHLGSVTALTNQSDGSVIERYSYDAWGQRRNATDWKTPVTAPSYSSRGYTGHEHLDDIGVIHMNGRIYDPRLGRMMSPDPVTQAPENGQNYNRYTYVFNNPLKYTDPSGFQSEYSNKFNDWHSERTERIEKLMQAAEVYARPSILVNSSANSSQTGDHKATGGEAAAQEPVVGQTFYDGFDTGFLESYRNKSPYEFTLFKEYASGIDMSGHADDWEYYRAAWKGFEAYAIERARNLVNGTPAELLKNVYGMENSLESIPGAIGVLIGGGLTINTIMSLPGVLDIFSQANEIATGQGVTFNEALFESSFNESY